MTLPPLSPYTQAFDLTNQSWSDNESRLMRQVTPERGLFWIHIPPKGIVVPRKYRSQPLFRQASETLAAEGMPVHLRLSGGGVVPQSPHTVNLNLAYSVATDNPFPTAEAHYLALCRLLQTLFDRFGIATDTQTVTGSFCDGRFNLAANGRKIAGTAQFWQRDKTCPGRYTILSHAVIIAAQAEELTKQANRFEQALGSNVRYLPERTVSVKALSGAGSEIVADELNTLLIQTMPV
ncbi:lipoyl protein ligase domain-containing protein [Neisseria wadsworthii]|uniref:lipoyl protein ligase domain-containing protein n=1 Tax=Neisseria wadsworthii TaxID=607711 RepID=UPI000D30636E|nr:hypothetical protein [Neisseria wadsworthii]